MRAIVARPGPAYSVQDVANGWIKGLRANGVRTLDFNLDERFSLYSSLELDRDGDVRFAFNTEGAAALVNKDFSAACWEILPEVAFIISGFFIQRHTYDLLHARGVKIVLVCTESPYEDDRQTAKAHHADLVIVNDPTNLESLREANPNTHYIPHAYDPDVHHPGPTFPHLAADVFFAGTGYPSRIEFLEQVDWAGIDLKLAGNWTQLPDVSPLRDRLLSRDIECIENSDAAEFYRSARSSLNLYRREANAAHLVEGWAMGPREVELAASGCFYLTEERGENRFVLPMVPTFDGPGEYGELLRHYLARDDERTEIASKAREAIADRTFDNHLAQVLNLL